MSTTSRAGLLPTQKRHLKLPAKSKSVTIPKGSHEQVPKELEATSIGLTLRPFGGLYNPYAKGCSVLCNHPAPSAVRDVINQVKTALTTEGKNNLRHVREKLDMLHNYHRRHHETDNIPEDLFRRYTDTDSRPLTPSPTVTSIHTLTSSFLNNRRCITPEMGKTEIIKRKQIILDLRRSHSQETLYWKPSSEVSQSFTVIASVATVECPHTKSAGANEERTLKGQKSTERRPKSSVGRISNEKQEAELRTAQSVSNNDDDQEPNGGDLRKGRRRKKIRPRNVQTIAFHPREDPETQVATLGPFADSLNPSTRPSLIPNGTNLLPIQEKLEDESVLLKGSFLTNDAFQALKKELDVDTIENTFGRYLNRALREAIKYMPPRPAMPALDEPKQVREDQGQPTFEPSGKMPRKLSKSATRFEVPLDLRTLEKMNVLEYLSKYVWVSRYRKQLYKRVFLKYLTQQKPTSGDVVSDSAKNQEPENHVSTYPVEYIERTMSLRHLATALEDVLEFYGTEKNVSDILCLLDYENLEMEELDFRTWCGVVSFAERLAQHEVENNTDSCDELEKADFNSMTQRLEYFKVTNKLREVFRIIRSMHFLPFE